MKKIIGILGGMGPGATADAFSKLINHTQANCDQEHIPVVIVSLPDIPDRTENIIYGGPSPLHAMIKSLKILESTGVSCIIMPCNTAHFWYETLRNEVDVEFISIIDAACNRIINDNLESVALLATTATVKIGLYQKKLANYGIKCFIPDELNQYKIMQSIIAYKAGEPEKALQLIMPYIAKLESMGINKFIMGCTEIPIILQTLSAQSPEVYIDATEELIKETLRWYYLNSPEIRNPSAVVVL